MIMLTLFVSCAPQVSPETLPATVPQEDETDLRQDSAFFPLGFMGVYPEDESKEPFISIAASGFNVVHEFRGVQEIEAAETYLAQAEAAGLKVIQNMPACRLSTLGRAPCQEQGIEVWDEAGWGAFITTLSTHDNLVAWFLPDEIADYTAAEELSEWVRKYDPQVRPVYGNPGTFEYHKIARFPQFSDFIWAACYPEHYGEPRAIVTYGMNLDARAAQGTDTRWGAILQFFDSAQFGKDAGHPTGHELRCDSYQAIVAGATGLWYFAYERGNELDNLLEEVEDIADEISGAGGLEQVILSEAVAQTITKRVTSGPRRSPVVRGERYDSVQMLQKEHQGIYLFAVNIGEGDVDVEFAGWSAEVTELEVLFEGRHVPVLEGKIRDSLAPCDVRVYRAAAGPVSSSSP
jgi:hypothetical protein